MGNGLVGKRHKVGESFEEKAPGEQNFIVIVHGMAGKA